MIENRLPLAIGASLLVNAALWAAVGTAFAAQTVAPPPAPIEMQRIVLHPDGKKIVKVVKPEEVKKKVERIVKEHHLTPPPKPKEPEPPKTEPERPQPRRTEPSPPKHAAPPPPPQGAHNRMLTAKPTSAPKPQGFTALRGGDAIPGKPTAAQAPGTATTNPAEPPKVAPPPEAETKPDSKSIAPPSDPSPKTEPKLAPPPADPPKAAPPPPKKPKKKGPSRDAQYSNGVNPTFPDELKSQDFKKFVRVRVEIAADGSFTVTLRTSSGNDEVDKRVLDALKKWIWKPKLVEGEPVDSTQLFRFDFEVK